MCRSTITSSIENDSRLPSELNTRNKTSCLRSFYVTYLWNITVNYTDDTTPYGVANNTVEVVENLTNIIQKLFTWFASNQMSLIAKHTRASKHPNS